MSSHSVNEWIELSWPRPSLNDECMNDGQDWKCIQSNWCWESEVSDVVQLSLWALGIRRRWISSFCKSLFHLMRLTAELQLEDENDKRTTTASLGRGGKERDQRAREWQDNDGFDLRKVEKEKNEEGWAWQSQRKWKWWKPPVQAWWDSGWWSKKRKCKQTKWTQRRDWRQEKQASKRVVKEKRKEKRSQSMKLIFELSRSRKWDIWEKDREEGWEC